MSEHLDLTRRQQRWADRLALGRMLEGTGSSVNTRMAEKKLGRAGIDLEAAAGQGAGLNALQRIAMGGALGGKRAKFLGQTLQFAEFDKAAEIATNRGADDIARAYGNLSEAFGGSLGADVDMGSPAVLDAVRRYQEGRGSDTQRFVTSIGQQTADRRAAVLGGQLAPTLDETGSLVAALEMLREEQRALAQAQRGSIYGSLLGGGPLGAAIGGAVGGRGGALAGMNAGPAGSLRTQLGELGKLPGLSSLFG